MTKPIGDKERQVRALRETRGARKNLRKIAAGLPRAPDLGPPIKIHVVTDVSNEAIAAIFKAPVNAAAQPKEKTMKKAKKAKTQTAKRSVSEAAANLKAAKAKAKVPRKPKAEQPSAGAKTSGPRPGSKTAIVAALLTRPEGCTGAEILAATKWPTVSVPQQAKAAGLALSKQKDGKVTRYRGAPI